MRMLWRMLLAGLMAALLGLVPAAFADETVNAENATGTAIGQVKNADGDAVRGVQIIVYDAALQRVAATETDKNGDWQIASLPHGHYSVQYKDDKYAVAAASFTLDDKQTEAVLPAEAVTPAKLKARAFVDANNNGTSGKGEGFMKDVEVLLLDAEGRIVDTDVTDKNGYATLSAPEGKYYLRAHAPEDYGFGRKSAKFAYTASIMEESSGRTQQSILLTLTTRKDLEVGIGLQPTCIVRGTVWNDLNADGVWQEDEPGIPGIRVTIKGGTGKELHDTVTDENGRYEFRQVRMGNYALNCYVPDEYVFTVKAKDDVEKISRMTTEADRVGKDEFFLERGEVYENHNIGLMEGLIIEGACFLDTNFNGYYDEGEQVLPDVEMRLVRQSNNVLLQQVTTDEQGQYRFVGQRGSTFSIRAKLPRGYVFTVTGDETGNRFAADGNKTEARLRDLTIENGGYAKVMVGAIQYGSISGRVYFDNNFSADWERGERIESGRYVMLLDAQGNRLASQKTDKNGKFVFSNLIPGEYQLSMAPEKGYAFTVLGTNNVMRTAEDGNGISLPITLGMGEQYANAGIGMIIPAVVSGTVFGDENDNGLPDGHERGLAGTVVRLMHEEGEAFAAVVDAAGAYRFNAVLPGSYYVQYELPEKGIFAQLADGGNTVAGENRIGKSEWFTVDSGDTFSASLCGGLLLSDISGAAFADQNGNAIREEEEPTLSGMVITLTPYRSDLQEMTIVTGEDGSFALNDLRPDTYTLTVTCPGDYVMSRLLNVSMNLQNGLKTQTTQLTLPMGSQWHEQMIGCVLPAVWTGEAYLDENHDGVRDAAEAPAVGERIELRDAETGEVVSAAVTDDHGLFTIKGIAPGDYELVYPLDEGNLTPKDGGSDFRFNGSVMTNGRVTICENQVISGTVLAVVRTTELGGYVWVEEYDGINPVKGATIHLMDAQGTSLAEFITSENGQYAFKGLMPADYVLEVAIPGRYVLVEDGDARLTENGMTSVIDDAQGALGKSKMITLRMAKHQHDLDVGMVLPGRLGDKVWLDLNGNGLQDGDEGGIPGVTIELLRGEKTVATTVSDQYGYYVFEGLYPTEYSLRVTWPAEVKPTVVREDIRQISSILREDGTTLLVTVESNKANYTADLGFVLLEEDKLPAGYGEGAAQIWKKK